MPNLIDRQRRVYEVGRLRLGEKRVSAKGKEYPASRDTWRLTSPYRPILESAKQAYGGELRAWKDERGRNEWELLTERSSLKCYLSMAQSGEGIDCESVSQWWEIWGKQPAAKEGAERVACLRRCDGVTCRIPSVDGPEEHECICGESRGEKGFCQLRTRMRLILSEVASLGTFRFETQSQTFSDETGGLLDAARSLGLGGGILPLEIAITFRKNSPAPGQEVERYPVAVLTLDTQPVSLPQLVAGIRAAALGQGEHGALGALPAPAPVLPAPAAQTPGAKPGADKAAEAKAYLLLIGYSEAEVLQFAKDCLAAKKSWTFLALNARDSDIPDKPSFIEYAKETLAECEKESTEDA